MSDQPQPNPPTQNPPRNYPAALQNLPPHLSAPATLDPGTALSPNERPAFSVLLSGFAQPPDVDSLQSAFGPGVVYSVRGMSHTDLSGAVTHIVHVVFTREEDAERFLGGRDEKEACKVKVLGEVVDGFWGGMVRIRKEMAVEDDEKRAGEANVNG